MEANRSGSMRAILPPMDTPERDWVRWATDVLSLIGVAASTWYLLDIATDGEMKRMLIAEYEKVKRAIKQFRWSEKMGAWVVYQAEEIVKESSRDNS